MNGMKKWNLTVGLAAALLFAAPLALAGSEAIEVKAAEAEPELLAEGTCGENLTWTLDREGVLEITGFGAMEDYEVEKEIYAPWYEERDNITAIVLGKGISHIGNGTFYSCEGVTEVEIPKRVSWIGGLAFANCTGLESVELSEGLLSGIGYGAFKGCTALKNIEIPRGVTKIGYEAFCGCTSLTLIEIPEGIIGLEQNLFQDCTSLTEVIFPEKLKKFRFMIGTGVFRNCTSLEEMVLPEEVQYIAANLFEGCTNLKRVMLPDGLIEIGASTFKDCTSLKAVEIPESVTGIEWGAFEGCSKLEEIVLPNAWIEGEVFKNCSSLKEIVLPKSERSSVPQDAFRGCTGLERILLEEAHIVRWGSGSFENCTSLTSLTIPANNTFRFSAFSGCSNIKEIHFLGMPWKIDCSDGVLDYMSGLEKIYATQEFYDRYKEYLEQFFDGSKVELLITEEHFWDEGVVTKAPSCTSMGEMLYTCTECEEVYVENVPADGHEWSDWETDILPTDQVTGLKHRNCNVCGESYERKVARTPRVIQFEDVSTQDYFYKAVRWAVEEDVTKGEDDITFAPFKSCSRAEIVTFLYRLMEGTESSAECTFTDVDPTDFYYEAMMWAVEKGITRGLTEESFGPFEECTREQIVTFLWRAVGNPSEGSDVAFLDVNSNEYYYPAICWALANGITTGQTETAFGVGEACNRADCVVFLQRTDYQFGDIAEADCF